MAGRNTILFTQRGPAVYHNVHRDSTGEPLLLLDEGEVKTLVLDFTAWLTLAETVSSAAVTAESVTCATVTATPMVTLTLSAATSNCDGSLTVVVTFSSGNKWRGIIRVRRTDRYTDEAPVGDYA